MTDRQKALIEKNGTLDALYSQTVQSLIRKKYPQDVVEAILNNYLNDPTNEKHKAEFFALQAYREECKIIARAEVYGNDH